MEASLSELAVVANMFVDKLPALPGVRAHLLGLSGELGAGKTTFVQMVAERLGVEDAVTSPTFTILKSYNILHPVFKRLVHVDAYRLTPEEADTIDWQRYVSDPENLILVEWPENLKGFPKDAQRLSLTVASEHTRHVELHEGH